ncbi:MAG TPA: hypothetical protein V6C72_07445, partial [Chroococcales cyanobacterium]
MTGPSADTQHVIDDLKHLTPNSSQSDYSHVVAEIGALQRKDGPSLWARDSQQINNSVNMKQLGFNENFNIVGVDNKGQLITRSEDGHSLQTRDPIHLQVSSTNNDGAVCKKWGNREFSVNPDGSADYTVKKGDNYYGVVKDALSASLGHAPTATEIMNSLNQMKEGYGLKDMNKIHPGDTIHIPMPKPDGDGTFQQVAPTLKPTDSNNTGALAEPHIGQTDSTSQATDQAGNVTKSTSGELNDNLMPHFLGGHGTKFNTSETTDSHGHLVGRTTTYGNDGTSLYIDDGQGGTREIDNVTKVQTTYNRFNGTYEST